MVKESPSVQEIEERAKLVSPNPIKLFYGETYDDSGNTIDSMKYYFFVANLSSVLDERGYTVYPTILVADTAACRNVSEDLHKKYMMLGDLRVKFIEKVNEIYGTNLNIIKMSDYIHTEEFQKELEFVIDHCKRDLVLMEMVEKSVPISKVDIEKEKGFMYSFDEITTIMDLDVKVGPPREDLYDNIAKEIALRTGTKPLMSLFLTPTFPLGKKWDYFFINEGIEEHGITAYKGASKRLQHHRILVGRTNSDFSSNLIQESFISTNPELPNPVLDIGIITEMAKQRLEQNFKPIELYDLYYSRKITPEELKLKVSYDVDKYILSKFK